MNKKQSAQYGIDLNNAAQLLLVHSCHCADCEIGFLLLLE